jgi:tRNA pseudouridine13 synthase
MKLKHRSEDFQVEERIGRTAGQGEFALYRLSKRGLGTLEVVDAIARRCHLPRSAFSYGGLKDRHADTVQWLCIQGPPLNLKQTNFQLSYAGQTDRPLQSADITGNFFRITLRDLSAEEVRHMVARVPLLERDGAPNYFDRQRFGSLGASREFIARPWIGRNYERALWLALADPNPADRPADRHRKELLRERWGQWETLLPALSRRLPQQAAVAHLARQRGDFRGALARLPATWRRLWIEAFQSYLWNRLLSALLRQTCPGEQLLDIALAGETVAFYEQLGDPQRAALRECQLPLPSSRNHLEEGPLKTLADEVLGRQGFTMRDLVIDYPRDSFFSKGSRPALFLPRDLSYQVEPDECYPARQKLVLAFELPRGCYATILIRCLEF